jgi:hypothetical protein
MNTKHRLIGVFFMFVMALVSSCGGSGSSSSSQTSDPVAIVNFPVDEAVAAVLISTGVQPDIARYFAAAKLSQSCASTTDCTYRYTYPNGATRDLSIKATPNQQYTPTARELAATALIARPVYNSKFTASGVIESDPPVDTQIAISFFVPASSAAGGKTPVVSVQPRMATAGREYAAASATDGFQFNLQETGAKGADVSIGAILDHYQDLGKGVKSTGSAYAVASALSDISGAMQLSKQVKAWQSELDALEKCAAKPTNSLSQSDPNYSANTVAKLRAARVELKAISAVRFVNIMGETGEGIHPVTAVLGIPLKSVHSWTEQSLKDASEQLMQDARSSVVSCVPSCPKSVVATGVSESQINLTWSASTAPDGIPTSYTITGGNTGGVSTNLTSRSDLGLARSKTYCYSVTAFNEYGASENCPQACGTTFGPPIVSSTGPTNNAKDVALAVAVTATFTKAVAPATVTAATFTLAGPRGAVAGSVSYSGTTATLSPTTDLAPSTLYTATISAAVKDLDGTAMEANYVWSFTTGAAPLAGNVQFTTTATEGGVETTNGIAAVKWTLFESLPDVRTYTASGTISGSLAPVITGYTCTPIGVTSNISSTDKLYVYTAVNTIFQSTHAFNLMADNINDTLSTTCKDNKDGSTITIPFSKLLYVFVGGSCSLTGGLPKPVPFTDEKKLAGNYSCTSVGFPAGGTTATWSFLMP